MMMHTSFVSRKSQTPKLRTYKKHRKYNELRRENFLSHVSTSSCVISAFDFLRDMLIDSTFIFISLFCNVISPISFILNRRYFYGVSSFSAPTRLITCSRTEELSDKTHRRGKPIVNT